MKKNFWMIVVALGSNGCMYWTDGASSCEPGTVVIGDCRNPQCPDRSQYMVCGPNGEPICYCGNPPADSGTPDTGTPVDASADTGTPPADSGTPPADTGTPPVDSGIPPTDAGCSPGVWIANGCNDAVCDRGTTGQRCNDAGTGYEACSLLPSRVCRTATDGGVPPVDTGTPPVDSGTPPVDSGTPPVDSGTPPVDTGTPPVDSGIHCTPGVWDVNGCNDSVCGAGNTGRRCNSLGSDFEPCSMLPGRICEPPIRDSGVDTGTPPADTGTPPADSGMPPADTGTPPADTGTPPADSGPSCTCVAGTWTMNNCNAAVCGAGNTGVLCNPDCMSFSPCAFLPGHTCVPPVVDSGVPPVCTAGAWTINNCNMSCGAGNTGVQCNSTGTGYGACSVVPGHICSSPVCTAGTWTINDCDSAHCGAGNTGVQCNSSGTGYGSCSVVPGHICVSPTTDSGTRICNPGMYYLTDCDSAHCGAGNTGVQCASDGLSFLGCGTLPGRTCVSPVVDAGPVTYCASIGAAMSSWAMYDQGCSGGWILHVWLYRPTPGSEPLHFQSTAAGRLSVSYVCGLTGWANFDAQCSSNTSQWRNWGTRGRTVSDAGLSEFSYNGENRLYANLVCPDIYAGPPAELYKVKPAMSFIPGYTLTCPDGRRY